MISACGSCWKAKHKLLQNTTGFKVFLSKLQFCFILYRFTFFFCFVRLMDKTKGVATSCRKMKFCTVLLLFIFPVILHVRDLGQKYPFTLIWLVNYLILSLFRFFDNDTVSCQTLVTITKSQTENLFWRLITLRTNSSSYCKLIISARNSKAKLVTARGKELFRIVENRMMLPIN